MHHKTKSQEKVSCLFGSSILFPPDSLPASCGALAPFRLCSRCQPQSSPWDLTSEAGPSAPSPHPSRRVSRQASPAGECWLALILWESLPFALRTRCCTLLRGSEAPLLHHPQSPPTKGLPSVWNFSSFTAPSHWCRSHPYFLSLFFLFSFALPRYVGEFLAF